MSHRRDFFTKITPKVNRDYRSETENIDLDLQQGTSIGNIIVMTRLLVVSWALEKMNMRRKTHNQLNNVGEEKWHKSHHVTIDCKAR